MKTDKNIFIFAIIYTLRQMGTVPICPHLPPICHSNIQISAAYNYDYDSNGNCTKDGLNNLELAYNCLNLISRVSQGSGSKAHYHWSADGVKLSVSDPLGKGFDYLGSLVYERESNGLHLESSAFGGGRINKVEGANGDSPHLPPQ